MLNNYDTIVFDCDGVILQSNKLKSDAFAIALEGEDPILIDNFVKWHKANGGISRFAKFQMFYKDTKKLENWKAETEKACERFGEIVSQGLLQCPYIPGFEKFVEKLNNTNIKISVNTGGAETEIREVFKKRNIFQKFKKVYGSPSTKEANMEKLYNEGLINNKSAYFGDSKLDFDLAKKFNMDFYFITHETEWTKNTDCVNNYKSVILKDFTTL